VSGELRRVEEAVGSYRDARIVLQLRSRPNSDDRLFDISQIGALGQLLQAARGSDVLAFGHSTLDCVVDHDRENGSGLMPTLRAYFAHGGSVHDAAATLGVHRHTVQYRLQKVQDLAGLSVRDGRQRLTLELAVTVLDLAEPLDSVSH